MECFSPITIPSRCKFFSTAFANQYLQTVPCGRCAACQRKLHNEWYFRAFQEYQSTISKNGYMLMDCLTYSEDTIPRVSRYIPDIPSDLDFRCFDYRDLRLFFVRLRRYLHKKGYNIENTLRYFAAAEYGTKSTGTHRSHIHLLFYVTTPNLSPYDLSRAISKCWSLGRTDGIPWKPKKYVDEYTIKSGVASSQRACKYVSKYVMKNSEFQHVVDDRLNAIMYWLFENRFKRHRFGKYHWELDYYYREVDEYLDYDSYGSFLHSEFAKKMMRDLKRVLNQFHRQSLGFGAEFLDDVNIDDVINTNILSIPDKNSIMMRVGLPTYYKRKLFYEQVEIKGRKYWHPTALGRRYLEKRKLDNMQRLINDYRLASANYGMSIPEPEKLADYVLNVRGRIDAPFDEVDIVDRSNCVGTFYNYTNPSDKSHFHMKFATSEYLGFVDNYIVKPFDIIPIQHIIDSLQFDANEENILYQLQQKKAASNQSKQRLYDNQQRLQSLYKDLFGS